MYEQLLLERQELINNMLATQQYLASCEDDHERKLVSYQLVAMQDYKSSLDSRIPIHNRKTA